MNEDQKRRQDLQKLVVAVLVIAIVVCFAKIIRLENEISSLENALNRQHQRLMNEVESIYGNVDQMLREEASLLSGAEAEYGEINLDEHTVDVTVKLVPKLLSDDMKIQVSINGRNAVLSRNENTFTGTIPVDVFNVGEQMLMTIDTSAGTQTQYLSEIRVEYLWEGRIPNLYYNNISGNGMFTEGKYVLDGDLNINCSSVKEASGVEFEKFILITQLNGKEINRKDISQDVLNYEHYPYGGNYWGEFKMECAAKEGDELAIYLEATDSLGYLHRMLLHHWKEENGAMAEAVDGSEYIYDPKGVQIFP